MKRISNLLARIPAPYRAFACALLIVLALLALVCVCGSFKRSLEGRAYTRAVADVQSASAEAHARSTRAEAEATEALAEFENLEIRKQQLETRIVTTRTRANESINRADNAKKKLYEIRQTPVDPNRPVDDVRRHDLRANIIRLYPELAGNDW